MLLYKNIYKYNKFNNYCIKGRNVQNIIKDIFL